MTQSIALNVTYLVVCAGGLILSAHYFLFSKPAIDGPVDRARLIFGQIHPGVLIRVVLAAAITWSCWLLSNELVTHGYRVLAGMTLAMAAPAAIALGLSLIAFMILALAKPLTSHQRRPVVVMPKHRVATAIIFMVIIVGFALIPILR